MTPKQADEEGDQQTAKPRGTANPCRTDDGRAPRVTLERSDARDHRGKKEQEVEDSPPDWAGSSDDDERATHQNLSRDRNWPWRAAGRPWDHGNSSGVLAQRPNEPSGEPRRRQRDSIEDRGDGGGIQLVPSRMWQSIQQTQAPMAQPRRTGKTTWHRQPTVSEGYYTPCVLFCLHLGKPITLETMFAL